MQTKERKAKLRPAKNGKKVTFSDMLAVGMDFDREDFSLWSPIMRSEHFLARFETEKPEVFNALKRYLRHGRTRNFSAYGHQHHYGDEHYCPGR
jgi:hypothetical protein